MTREPNHLCCTLLTFFHHVFTEASKGVCQCWEPSHRALLDEFFRSVKTSWAWLSIWFERTTLAQDIGLPRCLGCTSLPPATSLLSGDAHARARRVGVVGARGSKYRQCRGWSEMNHLWGVITPQNFSKHIQIYIIIIIHLYRFNTLFPNCWISKVLKGLLWVSITLPLDLSTMLDFPSIWTISSWHWNGQLLIWLLALFVCLLTCLLVCLPCLLVH